MSWLADLLLAGLLATWGHTAYHRAAGRRRTREAVGRFSAIPALGTFQESSPQVYFGPRKQPHAVLLLHSFSACAGAFRHLTPALAQAGIPYLAPNLTGFGLDDTRLLEVATRSDWLRDTIQAYDLLAAIAEEVSVVGHSYGTLLACELANHRPIKHLVMISPYFHPKARSHQIGRRLAAFPLLAWIARLAMPYAVKRSRPGQTTASDVRDAAAAPSMFTYPAMPSSCLGELWRTPAPQDLARIRCASLTVVYGVHDQTSDLPPVLAALDAQGVAHRTIALAESGHSPLEDFDRDAAVRVVIEILGESPVTAGPAPEPV